MQPVKVYVRTNEGLHPFTTVDPARTSLTELHKTLENHGLYNPEEDVLYIDYTSGFEIIDDEIVYVIEAS